MLSVSNTPALPAWAAPARTESSAPAASAPLFHVILIRFSFIKNSFMTYMVYIHSRFQCLKDRCPVNTIATWGDASLHAATTS